MLEFDKHEKEIIDFWKKNKTFDKLRKKNKGKKKWSFIDGPITANNKMGVHHAWGRTYKDLFHRFKAMQGHEMRYQNGFDCQGLWVEREEEKDLGLRDKKDIEKFGILNFVKACKKRVEKFSKIQTEQSIRLGYWMDWENSYYTNSDNNNLHNWHLLKKYFEKGWLYKGKDSVPWCWRCGTASSKHDIVTEGYKEVTHKAVFMQFPLKGNPDTYFLIWTTTPWTIPANVAIAVNPKIDYVKVENDNVKYWLAESRIGELEGNYKILERKKGKDLKDKEYVMPYMNFEAQKDAPHKVVLWDLVSEEDGTGIVHIAPGCGAEDFNLGRKEGLPAISPLDDAGIYKEGFEEFSGKKYSEVTEKVLEDLEQRRFVYKIANIRHRYPHCWRCESELVFRLVDEWYVKSEEIREKLIDENRRINWYPEYGKKRQEEWFKVMGDWLISRKRYWGLPLPIWECDCGHLEVIGGLEELEKKAVNKKKVKDLPEIHRPWIDEIEIKCEKCGKNVKRIEDVGDAWLDAGIVPFSTLNYLSDKKHWKQWFPADLISESIPGQFRGWFNALMWDSISLAGEAPFKALFGYELLKDERGQDMHKSKGNAIWFDDAVEKVGADPIRLLYCLQDPSQELRFGYNVMKEPKSSMNILFNLSRLVEKTEGMKKVSKAEDKWILSRYNSLVKEVTEELEDLHPHKAIRALQNFWLNDLSRKYIQFVRDRISEEDVEAVSVVTGIYIGLLKLCAPFIPFLTEKIWQELRVRKIVKEDSVHLCDWPKSESKKIDSDLEKSFDIAMKVVEAGLAQRDSEKIGLRWPLQKVFVESPVKFDEGLKEIIARQLNVKEVSSKKANDVSAKLDLKINDELEGEGFARELARKIQAERKNAGLHRRDLIELEIYIEGRARKLLGSQMDFLKERINAKKMDFLDEKKKGKFIDFKIKDSDFFISFKKI